MKKVTWHRLLFILLVIQSGLMTANAHAVIFASDALYLYNGGKRITDNSVLVVYDKSGEKHLDVCEKGTLWLRQGPTWKKGPYTFIQTTHADILTVERWLATPPGKASANPKSDYQDYLRKKTANAPGRVSLAIPTVKESPALDRTPNPPPRTGMTGGKIGHNRYFRVDLETGAIIQIPRSQTP